MAIPIIPLVILGAGVFMLRRRRRRAPKTDDVDPGFGPIQTVVFIPPSTGEAPDGPSGEPGQPCDAEDGEGAWDDSGHCKTFWIEGVTDDAIASLAIEEWEARGRPGISDLCLAIEDPMAGELDAPFQDNPLFTEIVAASLQRYYGVGALFPPKSAANWEDTSSPYWVHKAWARASTVVRRELCGV